MKNKTLLLTTLSLAGGGAPFTASGQGTPPNIIVILADDQGFSDLGCYGATGFTTPHIDSLAAHGMRFTNFYDPTPISSPSRAGFLTGCYPPRVGIDRVLGRTSRIGISQDVFTLPEMLKEEGYSTLAIGKWHLGHLDGALPTDHGFEEFFGVPYSNDMLPLPLMHDKSILFNIEDQSYLTTLYTEKCVDYIKKTDKSKPFFIYLAQTMPHVPLAVSDKFKGRSERGLYGDVIMELDWSVGQIVDALRTEGIDDNTLVVITSDNGPWRVYGDHAGSAFPFRDGKFSRFEGGNHQFCIMYWKGHIREASVNSSICSLMDLYPTFGELAGAAPEKTAHLDGQSILPSVLGTGPDRIDHEFIFYLLRDHALGVRQGRWKLMLEQNGKELIYGGRNGERGKEIQTTFPEALYDLENDPSETTDQSRKHPGIVKRLKKAIRDFDEDIAARSIPATDYSL